jgi:peptide/nickel transport system substrate-binding protein
VLGVHRSFHSDRIRPGTVFVNGARWSSPETDKLMDDATVEPDKAKRGAMYQELIKKTSEASPIIYVLELQFPTLVNKQFKNVITSPLGIYGNYATAYKE